MTKKYSVLGYCAYSNTIRQFPANYLVAHFNTDMRYWLCDPDLAADETLRVHVFKALLKYENKYQQNGLELLAVLTPFNNQKK